MKRLIVVIVVISLIFITFFQFKNYRRFHPPAAYEYVAKTKNIDANYHNHKLVDEYYKKAYDVGSFARQSWYNYSIDVRFPDESNQQSIHATANYNQMLSRLKSIEIKLIASKKLKDQGYNNEAIAYIEKHGITTKEYKYRKLFNGKEFVIGDKNGLVWEYQKLLRKKGYTINTDGVFDEETLTVTKAFQKENGLYASGNADRSTLQMLLK